MVTTDSTNHERGQLLVVGAIGFAFIIIGLALVVNSMALVNLSGGLEANHPSASQYKSETATNVDNLVRLTNEQDAGNSYSTIESNLQSRYNDYQQLHERQALTNGQLVTQELVYVNRGSKIEQSSPSSFESADGEQSWTLVSNTERFREFVLKMDGDALESGDNLNDDDVTISDLENRGAFSIEITDGNGEQWEIYFYSRSADKDVRFRVTTPDNNIRSECVANDDENGYGTVNLAEATLNGKHTCEQLRFIGQLERPVDIRYENAHETYGTYKLLVSEEEYYIDDDDYGSDPSLQRIAYSAAVRVTYMSESETSTITIEAPQQEADGDYYGR